MKRLFRKRTVTTILSDLMDKVGDLEKHADTQSELAGKHAEKAAEARLRELDARAEVAQANHVRGKLSELLGLHLQ